MDKIDTASMSRPQEKELYQTIQLINRFAAEHQCAAGICSPEPLTEARLHMESRFTPFVSKDIERRANPKKTLPDVKSVIVLAMGHEVPCCPAGKDELPAGILSSLGVNPDYHVLLKNRLRELAIQLSENISSVRYKILVDSGGLDERALAVRAGLGFYGKNGMVISPVFGSFFHIGLLLVNADILPEEETADLSLRRCPGGCRRCIDACPSGAIPPEGYAIAAARCISYLTQKTEPLSEEEKTLIGRQLYGCDICRLVCPLQPGKGINTGKIPPRAAVPLSGLLNIDESEFTRRYGHTAMAWRGAEVLRRNAAIVYSGFKTKY